MPRIVVPYTDVADETVDALADHNAFFDENGDDNLYFVGQHDQAYWQLLAELWTAGESFVVVEQDIVIGPDTLRSFEDCPQGYCAAGYPYWRYDTYWGLGCTRFRAEFIARYPDLMDVVGEMADERHPRRFWCSLDGRMQLVLRRRGVQPCRNHGTVGHVGTQQPSHGCLPA